MHTLTIIQNLHQFYLQEFSGHNNFTSHQSHDQNKMSLDNRCSYSPSLQFSIHLITALSIYIIPATAYSSFPRLIPTPRLFRLLRTIPIGSKISPAKNFLRLQFSELCPNKFQR